MAKTNVTAVSFMLLTVQNITILFLQYLKFTWWWS